MQPYFGAGDLCKNVFLHFPYPVRQNQEITNFRTNIRERLASSNFWLSGICYTIAIVSKCYGGGEWPQPTSLLTAPKDHLVWLLFSDPILEPVFFPSFLDKSHLLMIETDVNPAWNLALSKKKK